MQRVVREAACAAAVFIGASVTAAHAAHETLVPGPQIQQRQQQQVDEATQRNAPPDVLRPTESKPASADLAHLPEQQPCFPITRLELANNPFGWLAPLLQPAVGQCVGQQGLQIIQQSANDALITRGYITSRVLVAPQSIRTGTLTLQVVPGRVSGVRASAPTIGWLRAALPVAVADLLSQHAIDQGLENLRRLSSQADATFDIAPGSQPGESELVLHPGTGKRWHAMIGTDNDGLKATGKYELSAAFTFDSPLHLYDQLQIAGTTNANINARDRGNQSLSLNYSVPLGHALLAFDASRSRYRQSVAGFGEPIEYAGVQSRIGGGLSAVVLRNAHARTELRGKLFHQISHNTIDSVEIPVQHRDTIGYELGLSHRQYVGNAVVEGDIAWRASLAGLSSDPGVVIGQPEFSGKTRVATTRIGMQVPFKLAGQPFSYRFGWQTQTAHSPLTPADYFTIGTRYNVRGFDQQLTLAAESGWSISNEIDWYLPTALGTQSLYAGVDAGRVYGPAAQYLLGQTLVGAVIGVRGSLSVQRMAGTALTYDISLGWPVARPAGFSDRRGTLLFEVSALF